MKNCIAANYGDLDEYTKTTERCKKNTEENEKSVCGMYLKKNLDMNIYKVTKFLVPLFLWKFQKDLDSLSSDYKQRQEEGAMKKMIDSGMTESKSIKMLEEIMKKYEKYKKEKYTAELVKVKDTYDPNKELEKVKEAAIKFKEGKLNELTFRDKADIL